MKKLLGTLVVFAGIACAQESSGSSPQKTPDPAGKDAAQDAPKDAAKGPKDAAKNPAVVCRLESVTWNPVRSEMTWLVSVWDAQSDSDRPAALEHYVIHVDAAVMEFNGEARAFDPAEAKHVRVLMDMISTYSVESTVWWDRGSSSDPDGKVIPVPKDKDATGTKGKDGAKPENPKAIPKPAPAMLHGPVALETPAKQTDAAGVVH